MKDYCILTDPLVHFSHPGFPGCENVYIAKSSFSLPNDRLSDSNKAAISAQVDQLASAYSRIIAVFTSPLLSNAAREVSLVIEKKVSIARYALIDSHSIGLGLGMAIQSALRSQAASGLNALKTEQLLRNNISGLYTLFNSTEPVFASQALSAKIIKENESPIYYIERDKIVVRDKIKTKRQLALYYRKFLKDFDTVSNVGVTWSSFLSEEDARAIRNSLPPEQEKSLFYYLPPTTEMVAAFGKSASFLYVIE